jgi:hypothetical protein
MLWHYVNSWTLEVNSPVYKILHRLPDALECGFSQVFFCSETSLFLCTAVAAVSIGG